MLPKNIAAEETLALILASTPLKNRRVLEIGCGSGDLAAKLIEEKAKISAIDLSTEAISLAKEKGVAAQKIDFLNYESEPLDLIIFSRSLHHISPLNKAIEKAHRLLKADGLLLIEDFAADLISEDEIAWLNRCRLKALQKNLWCQDAVGNYELDAWRHHHFVEHKIADSGSMQEAVERLFTVKRHLTAPYLYRYVLEQIKDSAQAAEFLQSVLAEEKQLIEVGKLKAIGLRLVAQIIERSDGT